MSGPPRVNHPPGLDHLDDELGENGRTHVHDLLVDYPGIVLIASETPEAVVTPTQEWRVS